MRRFLDDNRLQLWAEAVVRYDNADDKDRVHLLDTRLGREQAAANQPHVAGNEVLAELIARLSLEDSGQPIGELMYRAGWTSTLAEGTDRSKQNEFAQGLTAAYWYSVEPPSTVGRPSAGTRQSLHCCPTLKSFASSAAATTTARSSRRIDCASMRARDTKHDARAGGGARTVGGDAAHRPGHNVARCSPAGGR